jgi:hypothetical protein
MTAADLESLTESDRLRIGRLHRVDPVTAECELMRLKAEAARQLADAERQRASEEKDARRRLEMTAPSLSADDHAAIRRLMVEQGLDPVSAAVEVGRQRMQQKAAE